MNTQPPIAQVLARIEQAIQRVVDAVTPMSPEQAQAPVLAEGRSVKDVLGHLTWWDQWLLVTLPPAKGAPEQSAPPPIFDQIPLKTHWAEEMNDKVLAYYRSRAFTEIRANFTTTLERLLRRVSQLSDDDLYNPDGLSSVIGQPVAPLILGIYEHYEEHADEFDRLSARDKA